EMKRHLSRGGGSGDGRNIDQSLGVLAGEGAHQEVRQTEGKGAQPAPEPRERADSTADAESYYGLPMLKEPVWKWPIPTYFYVGGGPRDSARRLYGRPPRQHLGTALARGADDLAAALHGLGGDERRLRARSLHVAARRRARGTPVRHRGKGRRDCRRNAARAR